MRSLAKSVTTSVGVLVLAVDCFAQGADLRWGLLASPGFDRQPMKGVYFFPGEGACQASDRDATPEQKLLGNPNIPNDAIWPCHGDPNWLRNSMHYTYTPTDPRDLHWSDNEANRTWTVTQIAATHANVIVMSRWGNQTNNGAP